MQGKQPQSDALALLEALEARVREDTTLMGEWRDALEAFGGSRSVSSLLRFREWFLLERPSEHLGVPPALAWAPGSLLEGSAWESLLDSFLGIFRPARQQPDDGMLLEDLWSGRAVVVADLPGAVLPAEALLVGRFVLGEEGFHVPLPGCFLVEVPGLADAVERDLNAQRAENPRGRLSQGECERLFAPFWGAGAPHSREELKERLAGLLERAPGWDLARLRSELARVGAGELLDRFAFETSLDLEELRDLLPSYVSELAQGEDDDPQDGGAPAALLPRHASVQAAIERFERSAASAGDLGQRFRQLEHDLGLADGASEEQPSQEPLGPSELPGFDIWVQTYAWERGQQGRPLADAERAVLDGLTAFLDISQPEHLDASALTPAMVLGYLIGGAAPVDAAHAVEDLMPFLSWAAAEQDADLDGLLTQLRAGLAQRLPRIAALNAELAGRTIHSRARVTSTDPLRVAAGEGDEAQVEGLPAAYHDLAEPGDTLLGEWKSGHFVAAGLWPERASKVRASSESDQAAVS